MENKIQALTDKIYKEGVEKAQVQAQTIMEKTKLDAKSMTGKAQKDADNIVAAAQKEAQELRKNTESELKLYAGQMVEALKSEVVNLINDQVVTQAVKVAMDDKKFMQQLILSLATEWVKTESIAIETSKADEVKAFFTGKVTEALNNKVEVRQVNGKESSFAIVPENGAYKVAFGQDEFVAFFKEYLRPQLVEMLFQKD